MRCRLPAIPTTNIHYFTAKAKGYMGLESRAQGSGSDDPFCLPMNVPFGFELVPRRFGKARVFVEGVEVMVKRYSFLQQLTFSQDHYSIKVDNAALGPINGSTISIRVAAGVSLMVRAASHRQGPVLYEKGTFCSLLGIVDQPRLHFSTRALRSTAKM